MAPWSAERFIIMAKAEDAAVNGKLKIIILLTGSLGILVGVSATSLIGVIPLHNRLAKVETSVEYIEKEIVYMRETLSALTEDLRDHDEGGD